MKRWLLALISANLLAAAVLVFTYPHLMVSPGPLVAGHAGLATDCFACHAPLRGAVSSRCIACHALPDIGLRDTKGVALAMRTAKTAFHQGLLEKNCMACHSDHEGARRSQLNRKAFSHQLLQPATRARCEGCHQAPADTLHRQITSNCTQCHAQERWKPAVFEHKKFFLLDRDHNVACATCHTNSNFARYTCYGCHEHQPDKIRRKHAKEGMQNIENCVRCHRSAEDAERDEGSRGRRRD